MKLPQIRIGLAVLWLFTIIMVVGSPRTMSITDLIALTVFGILPPLAIWFWWHEPSPTLSESIHQVRDEGRPARSTSATD
jgi:hypothetical protein